MAKIEFEPRKRLTGMYLYCHFLISITKKL